MTVKTRFEIGDTIMVNGETEVIISVHLYCSENVLTERYYLGNGKWHTIKIKTN